MSKDVAVAVPRNVCVLNVAVAVPPSQGNSSVVGPVDTFSLNEHVGLEPRSRPTDTVALQRCPLVPFPSASVVPLGFGGTTIVLTGGVVSVGVGIGAVKP